MRTLRRMLLTAAVGAGVAVGVSTPAEASACFHATCHGPNACDFYPHANCYASSDGNTCVTLRCNTQIRPELGG